jgi:hypothetical protein
MYMGASDTTVFFGKNNHDPTVFLNSGGGDWGNVQMRRGDGWSRAYD